jgi:hypothetical protein
MKLLAKNMKTLIAIFLFALLVTPPVLAGESAALKLYPFISTDNAGEAYLNLWITNHGESEQTVLTENFTASSLGGSVSGQRLLNVRLCFDISNRGTKTDPEQWTVVPSLSKLGAVTLRKGETATSGIKLDREFVEAIQKQPDIVVTIRYIIGERIAQRYALWHGTIEFKGPGRALISK